MTRIQTIALAFLVAVAIPAVAQDKAAPKPAAPAAPAPAAAAAAAPAAAPAVAAPAAAPVPQAAAPAAAPAPAPTMAQKASPAKKKRVASRKGKVACTKLDDPWDNMCAVQKNAAVACKDLPTGKKVAKKTRKGKTTPVATENRQQQCIDNYMRNV